MSGSSAAGAGVLAEGVEATFDPRHRRSDAAHLQFWPSVRVASTTPRLRAVAGNSQNARSRKCQ
jgi:hypothetical protein